MKVLLLFALATFLLSVWSIRRDRRARTWPLLVATVLVSMMFLSLRTV